MIMQKPSRERSEHDLTTLEHFFSSYQVFAELKNLNCDRESMLLAFKDVRLRTFKQGETVFRYGDPGQEFFVILNGRVQVLVPTLVRFDSKEAFYEELLSKHDLVIWKSVGASASHSGSAYGPPSWENVKFYVEGELKERERMRVAQL